MISRSVLVFFATREGQSERIARRVTQRLEARGHACEVLDVRRASAADWGAARGVVLVSSVRYGKQLPETRRFVQEHVAQLAELPSLFLSVCMAVRSQREADRAAGRAIASDLLAKVGWTPTRVETVAGRLAYTQYGWFTRFVMKRIARKEGGATDTSRDHEYTDWDRVEALADELADTLER